PRRTRFRLALVSLALLGLLAAAAFVPDARLPIPGGLLVGAALGWLGLRHTHAEWRNGVRTYIPNPWIGGLLTLVLAGRLAWRYAHGGGMQGGFGQGSALTLSIAAVLVAYALYYGIGLVVRMRAL